MNYNTQNAKIASITEKTLIVGIDVGSETHYARAFDWRNYEYTKKPLEFSNTEAGFQTFKEWMEDIAEKYGKTAVIPGMEPTGHYWFALEKFLQDTGSADRINCLADWFSKVDQAVKKDLQVFRKILLEPGDLRSMSER